MTSGRDTGSPGGGWTGSLPNAVSVFRGLLVFPIVYYTVSAGENVPVLAVGLLGLAWLSDGLDGWLARRLDAQSELGRILDPLADKLVVDGTAAALWVSGRIPGWLVIVMIARDVAIFALGFLMRRRLGRVPRANIVGKTALVILVLTLAAYLADVDEASDVLKWIALAAVVASAVSYGLRMRGLVRSRTQNPDRVRP